MRSSRQFQASLFFYEKILSVQKASKLKVTKFSPLNRFYAPKILAFVVFCLLVCVFVGWLWFDLCFCTLKTFS